MKIGDLIKKCNLINSNNHTAPRCVKVYKRIKGIPNKKPIYSEKTMFFKINLFKSKSREAQTEFLNKNFDE